MFHDTLLKNKHLNIRNKRFFRMSPLSGNQYYGRLLIGMMYEYIIVGTVAMYEYSWIVRNMGYKVRRLKN